MKKEISNDLLEYNTFSSKCLTSRNQTTSIRKDIPSKVFQGGKQKYKITNIQEINKIKTKTQNFNDNKENNNENNSKDSKIKNDDKLGKLLKIDQLKEKFSKLQILTEEKYSHLDKNKYNMDIMDHQNNYDTPRSEPRLEHLYSYRKIEERRKTNYYEKIREIKLKHENFSK